MAPKHEEELSIVVHSKYQQVDTKQVKHGNRASIHDVYHEVTAKVSQITNQDLRSDDIEDITSCKLAVRDYT